jgi:hypothetical protein
MQELDARTSRRATMTFHVTMVTLLLFVPLLVFVGHSLLPFR